RAPRRLRYPRIKRTGPGLPHTRESADRPGHRDSPVCPSDRGHAGDSAVRRTASGCRFERGPRGDPRPRTRTRRFDSRQLLPGGSVRRARASAVPRSEEHTSELQSRVDLVCRLLLEKKKKPLQLKLLTTYIPKTSAFTLAFSTSQRLRTTRARDRTLFTSRHYLSPPARTFCQQFYSA